MSSPSLPTLQPRVARFLLLAFVLFFALLLPHFAYWGFAEGSTGITVGEQTVYTSASSHSIVHGVHLQPIFFNNSEIDAFNDRVGKKAGIVMTFYSWGIMFEDQYCGFFDRAFRHPPYPQYICGGSDKAVPEIQDTTFMLTWEPNANPPGEYACPLVGSDGKTNLNAIINGSCNKYIDEFARRLKQWNTDYGDKFMLRFMHEMNITNSPWWKNDPTYPAQFRAAFQHVVDRFRKQGVSRDAAQFVWSPNYMSHPNDSWNSIPNYYPGDAYVDWIGLSGYNWYTSRNAAWRTFSDIFDSPDPQLDNQGVIRYLMCHYAKPIVIAEIGSMEGSGGDQSKAAWIADTYSRIQDFPFVRAIVWFNDYAYARPDQTDFRVTEGSAYASQDKMHYPGYHNSLGAPTEAYKKAISDSAFIDYVPPLSEITPSSTYCGPIPPERVESTIELQDAAIVAVGNTVQVPINAENLEDAYHLSLRGLPAGYAHTFAPSVLAAGNSSSVLSITVPQEASPTTLTLSVDATSPGLPSKSQELVLHVADKVFNLYVPAVLK